MIISHKYKYIFIKTQKTASTSLELYLSKYCEQSDIITPDYTHIIPPVAKNYKGFFIPFFELLQSRGRGYKWILPNMLMCNKYFHHISANSVKARISNNIWSNYYKFCVERNPWDKAVSYYFMKNHLSDKNLTFDSFIKNRRFPHNLLLYTSRDDIILVDRVIRYEHLNDELDTVFRHLEIPFNGTLNIKAKSNFRKTNTPYRNYYNDEQRRIIEHDFKKEIDLFGYDF